MGGAVELEGNMTPVAEFNVYADAVASARVYALTSPNPNYSLPPTPPPSSLAPKPEDFALQPYPKALSKTLKLTQFPLDVTTDHMLVRDQFFAKVKPLADSGSPLAAWVQAFVGFTFEKMATLQTGPPDLSLHDPLCIWYALTSSEPTWTLSPESPEDIRVECAGQWTRGMCIVDRRGRLKAKEGEEVVGDIDGWLSGGLGNRVGRVVGTPGKDKFGPYLLERIFG
jgi:inosine-uridine nucleoside N-ribohydrolase